MDEQIAALMADEDIALETRKAKAVGIKAGEMIAKFRASNPNPTRGEYYNECVNQSNVIRPICRDDIDTPTGQAEIASDCETQTSRKYDVSSQ